MDNRNVGNTLGGKEQNKIDKLFDSCKDGIINTQMFKNITGRYVMIGGRRDYSKYSGRALREIRAKQAEEALRGQECYADGTLIDKSRIVDLWL